MSAPTNADTANEVVAWYAMSVDEAVKKLATDTDKGLGATEASSRLEKYGPNRLPEGKKRGPFMRFVSQFNNLRAPARNNLSAARTKNLRWLTAWTTAYDSLASAARAAASSFFVASSIFGNERFSSSTAVTMAAATKSRVNHLLSAGTMYQGACFEAVARIASSNASMYSGQNFRS